ncbi:hypothetical protein [Lysobacter sp. A3-1-A15]|uniref:hypothetical protein n=1 Tax=Novilysobacter viscosus TaxID=3098602 RepID=UPI002EDB6DF4
MSNLTPGSIQPGRTTAPRRLVRARSRGLVVLLALHAGLAGAAGYPAQSSTGDAGTLASGGDAQAPAATSGGGWRLANFQKQPASAEVRHIAHWALDSGDNGGMPYMIIDKVNARVFVFDAQGQLRGAEPALLGMGVGDVSAEGTGALRLAAIRPQDRITPAGRFVAALDRDLKGQEILWIDYDDALALHRVVKGQPSERRGERLLSTTTDDNRISYGCINVPVRFYEDVVSPVFRGPGGVVYILPETGPARELFNSYEVGSTAAGGERDQR